jgi:hypothetical protein
VRCGVDYLPIHLAQGAERSDTALNPGFLELGAVDIKVLFSENASR